MCAIMIMMIITIMKKRSDATRTVRACCSKADPHTDRGDYNTLRGSLAVELLKYVALFTKRHRHTGHSLGSMRMSSADDVFIQARRQNCVSILFKVR